MCMCGAFDCPICHPGCDTIVQCDYCGEYMPKHMANEERKNYKVTYFCDDCHGKIRECEGCAKKIHIDDEEFANWKEVEEEGLYKGELYCKHCYEEGIEEGCYTK